MHRSRALAVVHRFEYLDIQDDEAPQLEQFEVHPELIFGCNFHL
jgi:hypothetical protein